MISHDHERYRRQQEAFISNHGGSTSRQVLLAIVPNICGLVLTASTLALIGKPINRNLRIFIEFVINIVPCVLCCTILSDFVTTVCLTMLGMSLVNVVAVIIREKIPQRVSHAPRPCIGKRRPFVTNFRALTNVITAVCILAVDFRIFPRKFAKTEIHGYSLMDTGVGLFVLANALVAPESRNVRNRFDTHGPAGLSFVQKMAANSKASVKNCAPLLIIGLGRFIAVEYSDYQKHVTEYGVHWNFFVTLAFVKMLTSTFMSIVDARYSLLSGIMIITMHEYALGTRGLEEWIFGNAPRTDFVSANREGLVSVPGYVGLYLIGIAVGRLIHSTYKRSEKIDEPRDERCPAGLRIFGRTIEFEYNDSMILCVKLSLIAVQACAVTLYCDAYLRISRRLANAGYCSWIIVLGCTLLALLLLVDITIDIIVDTVYERFNCVGSNDGDRAKRKKHVGFKLDDSDNEDTTRIRIPEIFEAVNYNGLVFFLIANLLTGIVNMSVKTLYTDVARSIGIIVLYIAVCILVAVLLYRCKIQIKLRW